MSRPRLSAETRSPFEHYSEGLTAAVATAVELAVAVAAAACENAAAVVAELLLLHRWR